MIERAAHRALLAFLQRGAQRFDRFTAGGFRAFERTLGLHERGADRGMSS